MQVDPEVLQFRQDIESPWLVRHPQASPQDLNVDNAGRSPVLPTISILNPEGVE